MIGTTNEGHRIIAAVPAGHGYAVTAVKRQPLRHAPQYVTWATDTKGNFSEPHFFSAHDQTPDHLRESALADMFWRAGFGRLLLRELEGAGA